MPTLPIPPFLPGNLEDFIAHVANHGQGWYDYYCQAYDYINSAFAAATVPAVTEPEYRDRLA